MKAFWSTERKSAAVARRSTCLEVLNFIEQHKDANTKSTSRRNEQVPDWKHKLKSRYPIGASNFKVPQYHWKVLKTCFLQASWNGDWSRTTKGYTMTADNYTRTCTDLLAFKIQTTHCWKDSCQRSYSAYKPFHFHTHNVSINAEELVNDYSMKATKLNTRVEEEG